VFSSVVVFNLAMQHSFFGRLLSKTSAVSRATPLERRKGMVVLVVIAC